MISVIHTINWNKFNLNRVLLTANDTCKTGTIKICDELYVDIVTEISIVSLSKTMDSIANYSAGVKSAAHVVFDGEIHYSQNT
jgi:hypothetical protein